MAPFRIFARFVMVKATMTVRTFNLVVPLAHKATAMRIADTARHGSGESGAVSQLIGASLRPGDVDSTNTRSTLPTTTMPGIRISTTATRTTTTSRLSSAPARSADYPGRHHADFSFADLVQAYLDCRRTKRNSASAAAFEQDQERNLAVLCDQLRDGSYQPGQSICFVVTRPRAREVWAAEFRDRIVHHLLYNRIADRFYRSFISDTCACIPGRGTLYAAQRLEAKIRSASQNWSRPVWYLKCDLANFFVGIDKNILWEQIAARVTEPWWMWLAGVILFHDPRLNFEARGHQHLFDQVPPHKRLINQPDNRGLPIGNLSSQFFANIHLDALDQFAKHQVGARHYVRYVDDFILLHESQQWLNGALARIEAFLPERLGARLNPSKTILQPIDRGVDFVGHVIKPWHTRPRRRTVNQAVARLRQVAAEEVYATANSYFGLLRQSNSSHSDRARVAKAVLRGGHAVNSALTKTYRRTR
ncbi:RNA-directed DNA polymerase [Massilia varians]|uniref:RNA-directed DNA polymerase n=1 Tax=Massilia varians TaxID=457921 RepID=UPI0027D97BC2|nr:reverse transcriptase domain-containing protein [Massilia varians]